MKRVIDKFARFARKQEGNATIEFVILFPGLMTLFLMGFEAGYYMVRNVSLERAVDITVRDLRLSNGALPDLNEFKQRLCTQASVFDDCANLVTVDVEPIARGSGGIAAIANGPVRCIDRNGTPQNNGNGNSPTETYNMGAMNEMMVMRVCLMTDPLFPTSGLAVGMKMETNKKYAIVATTAFVTEPGSRAVQSSNCGAGVGCGTGYGGGSGYGAGQGDTNGYVGGGNDDDDDDD
ncbi:MAG: pilus assembly protein, partial [Silicimonas sp.]|nr:pilus assembly protein [Silicimonas sp.]